MTDVNESDYGPAAITFVAVSKAEGGRQHEIAAIRVVDERSFQIEDFLYVRLPVSLGRPAGSMPPTVMPEACARALSHILKDSTLAAWDPDQVVADLDEVLGDASKLLDWDGEQPLDLASLVRPFLHTNESDLACEWAGQSHPVRSAAAEVGVALAVTRRAFALARVANAVSHEPDCPLATVH